MKKILAFTGSNSSKSINKQLVNYACELINSGGTKSEVEVEVVLLEHYHAPIYGADLEESMGIPADIKELREKFLEVDAFIMGTPEHNGMVPAFLKNYLDWISRVDEGSIFNDRPVFLMATSPGARGGKSNLENLEKVLPYRGAKSIASFSLPSFFDNFKDGKILDNDLDKQLKDLISNFV